MPKSIIVALLLASVFTSSAQPPLAREGIEWCDIWITNANATDLPRVLLIGDSITRGYGGEVEKRLAGKAYVGRLATSAFVSDPMFIAQITMVLDGMKWDVIHFNNGMHGWQHSEEEYRLAFPNLLATLHKHAPNAKLIWANTTSLKEDTQKAGETSTANPTQVSDARIDARNAIALELTQKEQITLNDLNTLTLERPELHSDNVHFNSAGVAIQAEQVAHAVELALPH